MSGHKAASDFAPYRPGDEQQERAQNPQARWGKAEANA
jgi:hypothetical protein